MLMPKRVRWRKQHKATYEGKAARGAEVFYGEYGLQALEGRITDRQIEAPCGSPVPSSVAARFDQDFPDKPMTKKPAETRMGAARKP